MEIGPSHHAKNSMRQCIERVSAWHIRKDSVNNNEYFILGSSRGQLQKENNQEGNHI